MFTSFNARAVGLKLSARETLRLASRYGFGGVDVLIRDALEENVDLVALKREMDDLGLKPGAFPLPFEWRTTEDARFADDLRSLEGWARAAASLGLSRTATWVMPETIGFDDSPRPRTFAFHVDRLSRIASVLNASGIRLGLEVIGVASSRIGRGEPFVHRLDQSEDLRAEIEARASVPIGILVDSWHLYAAGEPIEHALAWEINKIVWVHVADLPVGGSPERRLLIDAVRGLPRGDGATRSCNLLKRLKDQGYDGPVTAEPLAQCQELQELVPDEIARLTADSLRAIWPD